MKKPGLLKRIFSFGRKKKQEPEEADQTETVSDAVELAPESQAADVVPEASIEQLDEPIEIPVADTGPQDNPEVIPVAAEFASSEEDVAEEKEPPDTSDDQEEAAEERSKPRESEHVEVVPAEEIIDPSPKSYGDPKLSDNVEAVPFESSASSLEAEAPRKEKLPKLDRKEPAGNAVDQAEPKTSETVLEEVVPEQLSKERAKSRGEPNDNREPAPVDLVVEETSEDDNQPAQPEIAPEDIDGEGKPEEVSDTPVPKEAESNKDTNITSKTGSPDAVETDTEPEEKKSWLKRLSQGLSRSSAQLTENIAAVFTKKKLDDAALEDLEDILLQADLGVETATNIIDSLAKQRMGKDVSDEEVRTIMAEEIDKVLAPVAMPLELDLDHKPHVILVVGVNGSGKTTTIGKLTRKLRDGGYSTMLVAGDTFRAAAVEQLQIWGERTGAPVIARPLGSDSSGLAYDAMQAAKERGSDVLMMDTAGRLQNKTELMAELEKIIRVMRKQDPTAPHTVLLTLDATTGQNALSQVEIFGKVAGVNGLVMTKLDGSARGGILVAISAKYGLPVYFVGVGEQVEDLEPFEAQEFARSIAGLST